MAAQKTLVMGESGTGKSTSLRNLDPAVTAIVNPVGKPLPFKSKGKFTMLNNETKSSNITAWMKGQARVGKKILIVDDFQYLLSIPYMNRIHEGGWDKWNDFGDDYFRLIDVCAELPADVRVYYLTHCETLDNGITTIKLIGKLLREKITIEGLFTIVLRTSVVDQKYYFLTQNSGKDTVKSPMGMFDAYAVENDLAYIDDKICNYYEIGAFKSDAEMAARDQEVAGDLKKPDASGRRARGTNGAASTTGTAEAPARKSRAQVEAENNEKMADYQQKVFDKIRETCGDAEEVPYDEAAAAADTVPMPELEKLPRRTRRERQGEAQAQPEAPENYADRFMDIPDGTDEELPFPADAMNPPEQPERAARQRKTREIQPTGEAQPQQTQEQAPAAETAGSGRRVRRTR